MTTKKLLFIVRCFITFIATCLFASLATAERIPEINWIKFDFPPFEIASGKNKNNGQIDRIRTRIIEELTNYKHQTPVLVNQNRADRLFQQEDYCHISMLKPDKPSPHITYSKPHMTGLPHHIITSKNKEKWFLHKKKVVPLKDLLSNNGLTFSIPSRSMGAILDGIFEDQVKAHQIRNSASVGHDFFTLIQKGRIDYTIEYPSAIVEWNLNNPKSPLVAIPIVELRNSYPIGYTACSNTITGKKFIQDINSTFARLLRNESYINDYLLYLHPESTQSNLRQQYQESVLNHY